MLGQLAGIREQAAGLFTEQLLISAGGTIVAVGTRPGLGAGNEFFTFGSELGVILLLVMLGWDYSPTELITSLKQSRWRASPASLLPE